MTDPIYAVGDIHGQLGMLDLALDRIERDGGARAKTVFLGDYVDRGPDSRGVIDRLIQGQAQGRDWVTLKGNHDRLFQWFMEDPPRHDPHLLVGYHWFHDRLGGIETMASYGVEIPDQTRLQVVRAAAQQAVPSEHIAFLDKLPLVHQTGDLLFVHAGIRPGISLQDQTEEDLVWIRGDFHQFTDPHPYLIVHGHTPVDAATHYGNRVNLDTGAGYGYPLSVAVFEGTDCCLLTENGRKPLLPVT